MRKVGWAEKSTAGQITKLLVFFSVYVSAILAVQRAVLGSQRAVLGSTSANNVMNMQIFEFHQV